MEMSSGRRLIHPRDSGLAPPTLRSIMRPMWVRAALPKIRRRLERAWARRADDLGTPPPPEGWLRDPRVVEKLIDEVREYLRAASIFDDSGDGADPVRGVVLRATGREVFLHEPIDMLAQAAVARALEPHIEPRLGPTVLAYRRGRHRLTGPYLARVLTRCHLPYAAKADIRKYFDSVTTAHVETSLRATVPGVADEVVAVVAYFLGASIYRDADHPHVLDGTAPRFEPSRHTLLQGSLIAPLLSNVVGHYAFDVPFARAFQRRRVLLLRYADDLLVLGDEPGFVVDALDVLHELAERAGLRLHPDKTMDAPVDLRETRIEWLGKSIGAGTVRTPPHQLLKLWNAVTELDVDARASRRITTSALVELILDPHDAVLDLRAEAFAASEGHDRLICDAQLRMERRRTKKRFFGDSHRVLEAIAAAKPELGIRS